MGGGGGGGDGEPEFQIAPMIDVLLVMLIFFMSITSTQKMKQEKIDLPVAPKSVKRDNTRNEAVVNVLWDEPTKKASFKIEGREYKDLKLVADQLKTLRKERDPSGTSVPPFRILIRGARDVDALSINRVLNAAGEAGIGDVAFAVYNKEGE